MMDKYCKTEFTNMVMVYDGDGNVLVEQRKKYWCGIAFPGGHAERGESFEESAIREVKEETGLEICNLELCGIIHWDNPKKCEKYIVFAYKTCRFSGTLIAETDEGKVFWVKADSLKKMNLCPNFDKYLDVFFKSDNSEFFGTYC